MSQSNAGVGTYTVAVPIRSIAPSTQPHKRATKTNHSKSKFYFSKVPPTCVCSCSSGMSVFPLPMSPSMPASRVRGTKIRLSAYQKLLCKLASEGHNLSHPVNLKSHWGKLGTNNFVKIK